MHLSVLHDLDYAGHCSGYKGILWYVLDVEAPVLKLGIFIDLPGVQQELYYLMSLSVLTETLSD